MSALLSAIAAGFVFGLGLWISGMANPAKVIGFLDISGEWDPSLALVMAGAVAVTVVAFRLTLRRGKPMLEESFALPTKKDIDAPLVAGSAVFGLGWGIGGYCPGPGLTALATLSTESVVFVAAMVVGGLVHRAITRT